MHIDRNSQTPQLSHTGIERGSLPVRPTVTKVIVRSPTVFLFWLCQLERKEIALSSNDPGTLVGDIVRLYPATLEILNRHNLDLCCEAGYPLAVAARAHNLDLGRFLEELNQAIEGR